LQRRGREIIAKVKSKNFTYHSVSHLKITKRIMMTYFFNDFNIINKRLNNATPITTNLAPLLSNCLPKILDWKLTIASEKGLLNTNKSNEKEIEIIL